MERKTVHTPDGILLIDQRVNESELSIEEYKVWQSRNTLLDVIPFIENCFNEIILLNVIEFNDKSRFTLGGFEPATRNIYISRMALSSSELFGKVFLHELAHAKSNASDESAEFEQTLSNFLGYLGSAVVNIIHSHNRPFNFYGIQFHNLDNKLFGYANCRCINCESLDFSFNDDYTCIECKKCGKVYTGGYDELVSLNRQKFNDNPTEYIEDALRINSQGPSKLKTSHLLFEDIPIDGTVDEFISKLVKKGIIQPENELQRMTRLASNNNDPIMFTGNVLGLKDVMFFVVKSPITQNVGEIMVRISDYDFLSFVKYHETLCNSYGKHTIELSNPTAGYVWKFSEGDIMLLCDITNGLILTYSDRQNKIE